MRGDIGQVVVAQVSVAAAKDDRKLFFVADAGRLIASLRVFPTALREKLRAAVFLDFPCREAVLERIAAAGLRRLTVNLKAF